MAATRGPPAIENSRRDEQESYPIEAAGGVTDVNTSAAPSDDPTRAPARYVADDLRHGDVAWAEIFGGLTVRGAPSCTKG